MSQEESRKLTVQAIRRSKSGKEVADAMISHFRAFQTKIIPTDEVKKEHPYEDALSILNAPLFGLKE
jgi:hypothetical protein